MVAEATTPSGEGKEETRTEGQGEEVTETRRLSLGEIVRWGNPVTARARSIVVLAGGGRLVTAADWAGGAAVQIEGDSIVVLSDVFGEIRLPRAVVAGLVFAQRRAASERERLAEGVSAGRGGADEPPPGTSLIESGRLDVVVLANGDRLEGSVAKLERGSLTVEMAAGVVKLPLSRVEVVKLGGRPATTSFVHAAKLAVGLSDGSLVYADTVRGEDDRVTIGLRSDVTLDVDMIGDVVALQGLGGRIVYLSDLEPAGHRHVPYLNMEWPWTRDGSVAGGPLEVNGRRYLKGLGMHSASRLTYALEGRYLRFEAALAIDDSAEGRGSVTFAVYLLRDGQWNEAFKSGVVRGGEAPRPVSVDITGADGLTLTVDYADRGDEMDRAAWLDARLVKGM